MNAFTRLANLIGLAAVIAVNALAEWLPIGGKTTKELSDQNPVLVTPAGYAFSIWSLIYLLLVGFVIYQLLPAGRSRASVSRIGPWFMISCLLNIGWILTWHYEYVTSSGFVMLALLIVQIIIYLRVRTASSYPTAGERWLVRLPFSLYLGWISVATIVNIAVVLHHEGWKGFGLSDVTWTVIVLSFAIVLALAVDWSFRDAIYALVFVWAFVAIAAKQDGHSEIVTAAYIGAGVLAVSALATWFSAIRRQHSSN
ncbi:tryptophan-rich sensory protein [Paenibacillus sacheonensis]|uniref:Tryptophan-rich sensory protein n=1 Tax=Paenibacillus sacheonensis TaxID=742054 RepID=A0A7X5C2R2_9BACL|nr:tryptophan-rich sensory protein [Paenibacillus sacheonensis]MBM7566913.1 hypothetical protein [Paenibacillus sacheonensis]NBC71535.1 tryptophan-rich sensory protein [Paenibacillus sacheonensis]